jgi:outer membrane protein TolC
MSDIFGDTTRAELQQEITRLRADLAIAKTDLLLTQSRVERFRAHVAALKADRDEARREVCNIVGRGQGQRLYAADRGWDCFDAKEGGGA